MPTGFTGSEETRPAHFHSGAAEGGPPSGNCRLTRKKITGWIPARCLSAPGVLWFSLLLFFWVVSPGTPASSHSQPRRTFGWLATLKWLQVWVWVRMIVCLYLCKKLAPCPGRSPAIHPRQLGCPAVDGWMDVWIKHKKKKQGPFNHPPNI